MTERKKASASTLAERNVKPTRGYRETFGESSGILKEFLGVMLLRLAAGQTEPSGWRLFEVLLRQYYRSRGAL